MRESDFRKYSYLREINDLFVGRYELIQEFERKLINIENIKPTCIIASSYFDGMGRRTFLKNGLIKTGIIDKWYEPIPISVNAKESIEDFIYKLNFVEPAPDIFKHDFSTDDMSVKINIARSFVKKLIDNGEIIFLIDEGSIVLPNHTLVDWFKEVISDPLLQGQVTICLISKFKPYVPSIKKLGNVLSFQINELSVPDTQTFFLQYLNIIKQSLIPEDTKFFLKYLKGIPGQIIYAANLINSMGVAEAKLYVNDIEEFDELRALSIFDFLKDDELSQQMLIAFSKFEIISYDLVYKIFGESNDVQKSIQNLYNLSLFFSVSSTHDYLKLNTSISDYINRSKISLNKNYNDRIKNIAKEGIQKPLELNEYTDYSEFLFNLTNMIREKISIPSKFLIPSFILKSIIIEYNLRHYKTVSELAEKMLENENKFDNQIIRETKIWLCLAYCRAQNEKFFDIIKYFKSDIGENLKEYYFLIGFYYRNGDDMDNAESNFLRVLKIDENHSRTKRELVNVYLRKGEYIKAVNWARDNYYRYRTNIFHVQAYFTSLIKTEELTDSEIDILGELLEDAEKSLDSKAQDIYREMRAEFDFYINGDSQRAINVLNEALRLNPNSYFSYRALIEIYKRTGMRSDIERLTSTYSNLVESEFE